MGVDLDSGALVRASEPRSVESCELNPFDVAEGYVGDPESDGRDPMAFEPEFVPMAGPLQRIGAMHGRAVERVLRPLHHPPASPIFGIAGPAAPWWECEGDRPSISIVHPENAPIVVHDKRGLGCVFRWHGATQWLPVTDRRVLLRLASGPRHPSGAMHADDLLGFRPTRVVVALTKPRGQYCYKVAAGFLPKP